jgi:DNA ligase (NAD+)
MKGLSVDSQYDMMVAVQGWGLRVNRPLIEICRSIPEVITCCRHLAEIRATLPFECNGAVIKLNALDLQDKLGAKAHVPQWALAFEFARTGKVS